MEGRTDGTRALTGLWLSLAQVAGILLASGAVGYSLAGLFVAPSSSRGERAAWGFALGLFLLAASVPLAFLIHVPPRWMTILLAVIFVALPLFQRERVRVRNAPPDPKSEIRDSKSMVLFLLTLFGVCVYMLRALAEPMWSNDFLAIWGLKGKTIFGVGGVPRRLFTDLSLGYSHPEYPLGLPFLYAAMSFFLGRWDDQAMALLFPALQVATLLTLHGWLRRRGVPRIMTLAAVAVLAQFEPLYSAFLAGMADGPYSFAVLLLGTALVDALEVPDPPAVRRLALAAVLAVSTKNEGLLLTAAAVILWLFDPRRVRGSRRALAAVGVPAAALLLVGRLWKGNLPLRDFDFSYLGPTLILEFLPRLAEALHTAFREVILPSWPGVLCLAALIAAGRTDFSGDRILFLAALCALAYLLLPSLAVLGPDWLIRTSFARTVSALAPLTTAAVAVRLRTLTVDVRGAER